MLSTLFVADIKSSGVHYLQTYTQQRQFARRRDYLGVASPQSTGSCIVRLRVLNVVAVRSVVPAIHKPVSRHIATLEYYSLGSKARELGDRGTQTLIGLFDFTSQLSPVMLQRRALLRHLSVSFSFHFVYAYETTIIVVARLFIPSQHNS